MKKYKSLVFLTSLMLLLFSACSSDDDGSNNDSSSGGDGVVYPAMDVRHVKCAVTNKGTILTFTWKPTNEGRVDSADGKRQAHAVDLLTTKTPNNSEVGSVMGEPVVTTQDSSTTVYNTNLQTTECAIAIEFSTKDKTVYRCSNLSRTNLAPYSFTDGNITILSKGETYIYVNELDGKIDEKSHNIIKDNTIKRTKVLFTISNFDAKTNHFDIVDNQDSKLEP